MDFTLELLKAIGFMLLGAVINTIFKFKGAWRNLITKEFTCTLERNTHFTKYADKILCRVLVRYSICSTNNNRVDIIRMGLEFDKDVNGNPPPNPKIGEYFVPDKGVYHLEKYSKIDTGYVEEDFELPENLITQLVAYQDFKIRLVIITSQYGTVRSKWLKYKTKK